MQQFSCTWISLISPTILPRLLLTISHNRSVEYTNAVWVSTNILLNVISSDNLMMTQVNLKLLRSLGPIIMNEWMNERLFHYMPWLPHIALAFTQVRYSYVIKKKLDCLSAIPITLEPSIMSISTRTLKESSKSFFFSKLMSTYSDKKNQIACYLA